MGDWGRCFAQGVSLRSGGAGFASGGVAFGSGGEGGRRGFFSTPRLLDSSTPRLLDYGLPCRLAVSVVDNRGEKWG
jgi:hypothetical protein